MNVFGSSHKSAKIPIWRKKLKIWVNRSIYSNPPAELCHNRLKSLGDGAGWFYKGLIASIACSCAEDHDASSAHPPSTVNMPLI